MERESTVTHTHTHAHPHPYPHTHTINSPLCSRQDKQTSKRLSGHCHYNQLYEDISHTEGHNWRKLVQIVRKREHCRADSGTMRVQTLSRSRSLFSDLAVCFCVIMVSSRNEHSAWNGDRPPFSWNGTETYWFHRYHHRFSIRRSSATPWLLKLRRNLGGWGVNL